ncbi:MAG: ATP-binding cassette domain-containing protein [Kiritimatiellae bacterium]|nr:ATP-binding cassette domain-containing protein [Kiritimatiellia bacterium]
MIEFQDVSVHFGTQDVISGVNLRVAAGERIGVVGPNGAGKSTLFQLILGHLEPDHGRVTVEKGVAIGHVRQHPEPSDDQETLLQYSMRGIPRFHDMEARIAELHRQIDESEAGPARERLLARLGEAQSEFEHLGGYDLETRVKEALGGLGFPIEDFSRRFATFSGGWRMRAELARILASKPDLLLLDEPSNYLDVPAVEWLRRFLQPYEGTLLIISHDRYLLRSLAKTTVEVDAGGVTRYSGDFDYYMAERDRRIATLVAAKANQDRQRGQLERFVERFKAKATKASQAQSRIKQLEKMEEIRLPKRARSSGRMRLMPAPHCGAEVMRLEDVSFAYSSELRPVLREVSLRINRGDKIGLVGFNGMGKTTLLRVLAGVREPTSGTRVEGHKVRIGYQSQEFAETIPGEITVIGLAKRVAPSWTEKDLRSLLGGFGFTTEDIDKRAEVLSGGERIRLAFLKLFLEEPNFLLLDEPTTHLDLEGRQSLETALREYDGTICFVSHDIEFVRAIATSIIAIGPEGVTTYPGTYDEFRDFLARKAGAAGVQTPQAARQRAPGQQPQDAQETDDQSARMSSKELRKARADQRARLQAKTAPLRRRVEAAEKRIEVLEAEEKELSAILASGAPDIDYAATGSRLRAVQFDLGKISLEWEEAATELERIKQELE